MYMYARMYMHIFMCMCIHVYCDVRTGEQAEGINNPVHLPCFL